MVQIRWIASQIQKEFPLVKLRVAFVGYRDYRYDDPKPVESVDFAPLASGTFEGTVAGTSRVRTPGH